MRIKKKKKKRLRESLFVKDDIHLLLGRPVVRHGLGEVPVPCVPLDEVRVYPFVEEVGNARRPKHVRIDASMYPCFNGALLQAAPHEVFANPESVFADEQHFQKGTTR